MAWILHLSATDPRQNGLAVALRELGRIENALARAVFFNLTAWVKCVTGSFENQRNRASGMTLVVAAIILWNTAYLSRAIQSLKAHGLSVDKNLLEHLTPIAPWLGTHQPHCRLRLASEPAGRKRKF